jgi:hypothetical protein
MARLKMTRSRLRYLARCAWLAAILVVLSNHCGSPSNATAAVPDETASAKTSQKAGSPAAGATRGVKLSGRVAYRGSPPARRVINMTKDAKCRDLHGDMPVLDEDLIVSGGGLKNVFVRIQRGAPKINYAVPEKPAVLNQEGCMFRPRVQGVRVGQRLLIGNGDPVTHNVRSFPVLNPAFNFGQPPNTNSRERIFEKAEREIELQCDFHLWMHAYIFVMEHPFFNVSKDDGTYAIDDLPPGEYTLEAWHEKLGKQRKTVTVGADDLVDVNFSFPR